MVKYYVEIYDDEVRPKTWRKVILSINDQLDKESYRATLGQHQAIINYETNDYEIAKNKKEEMLKEGWKTRIKEVD